MTTNETTAAETVVTETTEEKTTSNWWKVAKVVGCFALSAGALVGAAYAGARVANSGVAPTANDAAELIGLLR